MRREWNVLKRDFGRSGQGGARVGGRWHATPAWSAHPRPSRPWPRISFTGGMAVARQCVGKRMNHLCGSQGSALIEHWRTCPPDIEDPAVDTAADDPASCVAVRGTERLARPYGDRNMAVPASHRKASQAVLGSIAGTGRRARDGLPRPGPEAQSSLARRPAFRSSCPRRSEPEPPALRQMKRRRLPAGNQRLKRPDAEVTGR